jgi:hypothetical protein
LFVLRAQGFIYPLLFILSCITHGPLVRGNNELTYLACQLPQLSSPLTETLAALLPCLLVRSLSKNSFFECIRDFFPKASAKVRTFYGLAKYFKNFFAGKCSFSRLSDRNQDKTPFYYYVRAIKGTETGEKAWDHGGKTAGHRRSGKEGGRGGTGNTERRGGKTGGGMEKAEA